MKIIRQSKVVDDIPCGTVFRGSIFAAPSTYLRFFNGCVDLINPDVAWTFNDHPGRTVKDYEELDVELVVK